MSAGFLPLRSSSGAFARAPALRGTAGLLCSGADARFFRHLRRLRLPRRQSLRESTRKRESREREREQRERESEKRGRGSRGACARQPGSAALAIPPDTRRASQTSATQRAATAFLPAETAPPRNSSRSVRKQQVRLALFEWCEAAHAPGATVHSADALVLIGVRNNRDGGYALDHAALVELGRALWCRGGGRRARPLEAARSSLCSAQGPRCARCRATWSGRRCSHRWRRTRSRAASRGCARAQAAQQRPRSRGSLA